MICHVHKDEIDTLDSKEIASVFLSMNDRRESFFGKI